MRNSSMAKEREDHSKLKEEVKKESFRKKRRADSAMDIHVSNIGEKDFVSKDQSN